MARLPNPGSDSGTWGNILNDFLSAAHNSDGSIKDTGVVASKYVKPSSGIPRTDLDSSAQASLANADAAVSGTVPDANVSTKGKIQLSGDLGGTADSPTVPGLSSKQASNADLTVISALAPSNNDVLQRKSGAWTNRTPSQLKSDLALSSTDVGLGSVSNDAQLKVVSNLADLNNAATARTNLGLSTAGGDLSGTFPNPSLSGTANVESIVRAQSLDQFTAPAGTVNMNSQRLTSLANGTIYSDAPNLSQLPAAWILDSNTWTRVSNTQFTISSSTDYTNRYAKGAYVKWSESSTVKYGVVVSSSFGSNTTTVDLGSTSAYVMSANPDLGSAYYVYARTSDFPTSFAWSPTVSGFSSNPTFLQSWWMIENGMCYIALFSYFSGTSNSTSTSITGPIACNATNGGIGFGLGHNNGTLGVFGAVCTVNTATISLSLNGSTTGWTNSGSKSINLSMFYPI